MTRIKTDDAFYKCIDMTKKLYNQMDEGILAEVFDITRPFIIITKRCPRNLGTVFALYSATALLVKVYNQLDEGIVAKLLIKVSQWPKNLGAVFAL